MAWYEISDAQWYFYTQFAHKDIIAMIEIAVWQGPFRV